MKYAIVYKCPLCGELKQYGETPDEQREAIHERWLDAMLYGEDA